MPHSIQSLVCFHCALPVPAGSDWRVTVDGQPQPMCCPGCEAVTRLIVESGLGDYYRFRDGPAVNFADLAPSREDLARYNRPSFRNDLVRTLADGRTVMTVAVDGLRCSACCWLIETRLRRLADVTDVRMSLESERCDIEWRGAALSPGSLVEEISKLGYVAYPYRSDERTSRRRAEQRRSLVRLGIAALATMQVMMFATSLYAGSLQGMAETYRVFLRWVSAAVTLPVVLFSARPFFAGAKRDLRNRQLGMDVPIALAIGAAFVASLYATLSGGAEVYFDSVCMFVLFLLIGRYFEARARDRAASAIESAVRTPPMIVSRIRVDGSAEDVSLRELQAGDHVLVKPGATIPADGVIVEGSGSVDEALLSGEHWPREKRPGDPVLGGSQNGETSFVIAITRVGEDSLLAGVLRLVEGAGASRPAIAQLADRVAGYFVPTTLLAAVAVAWWWAPTDPERAFTSALAVLIVSCPCALSLATPAALAAATGGLLRRGFLIASGHVLETLAAATDVVFDKTGTLTDAKLQLVRTIVIGDASESECLAIACALESRSEHPIARAFDDRNQDLPRLAPITDTRNVPGKGIEGYLDGGRVRIGVSEWVGETCSDRLPSPSEEGEGWIVLGNESGPLCRFQLRDTLRPEATGVVKALSARGLETTVASGDRESAVRTLADKLGVNTVLGQASAAAKLAYIKDLQERGAVVVMVGDGINDAPSLGGAHVSVAMGRGTDLAMSRADSVLLSEDLSLLIAAYDHAKLTRRVIRQNLAWAALYNLVAIPFAAAGWIPPYWAAAGMSASSLLVVGNALRLGRVAERRRADAGEIAAQAGRLAANEVTA